MSQTNSFKTVRATLFAAAALALLLPFNLGAGCSGKGGSSETSRTQRLDKPAPVRMLPLLDRASEDELGRAVVLRVTNIYPVDNDARLNEYVTLVAMTLATATEQPDRDWTVGVLASDEVNTFSAPGGYVLLTRGAVLRMRDESELAGAIAHEMGHVVKRHAMQSLRAGGAFDGLAEASRPGGDRSAAFARIADQLAEVVMTKGYSATAEADAEDEAVLYLTTARYDPSSYLRYLQRLQAPASAAAPVMPTHADLAARIERLRGQVEAAPPSDRLAKRFRTYVPRAAK